MECCAIRGGICCPCRNLSGCCASQVTILSVVLFVYLAAVASVSRCGCKICRSISIGKVMGSVAAVDADALADNGEQDTGIGGCGRDLANDPLGGLPRVVK